MTLKQFKEKYKGNRIAQYNNSFDMLKVLVGDIAFFTSLRKAVPKKDRYTRQNYDEAIRALEQLKQDVETIQEPVLCKTCKAELEDLTSNKYCDVCWGDMRKVVVTTVLHVPSAVTEKDVQEAVQNRLNIAGQREDVFNMDCLASCDIGSVSVYGRRSLGKNN